MAKAAKIRARADPLSRARTLVPYQRPIVEVIRATKVLQSKAEQATDKAEQYYITVGRNLEELKERMPQGTRWPAFVKKHFGYSQPRADELIRIADGRTTLDQSRKGKRERVRKAREVLRSTENSQTVTVIRGPDRPLIPTRTIPANVTYKTLRIATPYTRLPPNEPVESSSTEIAPDNDYDPSADEIQPGDDGYDEMILDEKVQDARSKASRLLKECYPIDRPPKLEKARLGETIQALKVLQQVLQEVYATRFETEAIKESVS